MDDDEGDNENSFHDALVIKIVIMITLSIVKAKMSTKKRMSRMNKCIVY